MKHTNYLLLLFISLLFSCGSKKSSINEKVVNNVKTFNSNCFTLNYPDNWRVFKTQGYENDIIVRIAPEKEINRRYMAIEQLNADGSARVVVYIDLDEEIDSVQPKYRKYIKDEYIREYSNYQFNISIEKKEIDNLTNFMNERKRKIENVSNDIITIEKVADNHFINKILMQDGKENKDLPEINQFHLMHYYYKNGLLYTLVFTTTANESYRYADEVDIIFRTFNFSDDNCN